MARSLPEQRRRADILAAAKACFVKKGFAATRMDDIARAASLSKGGLYFHFRSKHDLMIEVVREENRLLEAFMDLARTWDDPFPEQVDRLMTYYFDYLRSHLDAARISQCFSDEAVRNPAVAKLVLEGDGIFLGHLERLILKALERGELDTPTDPTIAARACLALIEGVKTKYLHAPDWPWEELLPRIRGMVLYGLFGLEVNP